MKLPPSQQQQLQHLYETAIYEVALAGAFEPVRLGRNPGMHAPPFAIITAYNPDLAQPSSAENAAANARLEARLRAEGYQVAAARGRSPDGRHVEPSFAVFNIPVDGAVAIASEFGQAAIVVWDGEAASIVWTSRPD